MRKFLIRAVWVLFLGIVAAVGLYFIPPVHEKLAWRVDLLISTIHYKLNPPEKAVFVPQKSVDQLVQATMAALRPTPSAQPSLTPTQPAIQSTSAGTAPVTPSPTATTGPTPTAIPSSVLLKGVVHEYEKENNCGPATLAMTLTYWKWKGTQDNTAPFLKPNPKDKNVMPYELLAYVEEKTDFKGVLRVGGDNDLLKRFVAAGFPVIVEKGFEAQDLSGVVSWMGHYEAIIGYDDSRGRFLAEDSFSQKSDEEPLAVAYKDMETNWRAFNYTYLVVYPPEREEQVMQILGAQADETANYQYTAQKASDEIPALTGRDLYFAWFNRGSSLVGLQDYAGAANAYDEAYGIYPSIPEKKRPWRMLWYQTGPYFAYFYSGRITDVINLSNTTIQAASNPYLEESYVWRARAESATGQSKQAINDLRQALEYHPNFQPALDELASLGVTH
jgi:tetratricopeptide (TPR) repeat protein